MDAKLAISRQHFFKVMMPGFLQKLNLPPAFCKKLKGEDSDRDRAVVRSCKGTWKMNVCRNPQGLMSFKDGWPEFVDAHELSVGDFVVFEHIADLHFNAFVFDLNGCEKEFVVEFQHEEAAEAVRPNCRKTNTKRKPADKEAVQNPYFILTMKPHHAHKFTRIAIPASFRRSNNLKAFSSLILTDPRNREWAIKLSVDRSGGQFRTRMKGGGWHRFYASNKLKEGDVCVFELNRQRLPTVLMDVKIIRVLDID
ncbi:UNVERIFIED_CONTAM: B3 domain-containing protein REM9 [Sesamum latifolium]|uniref:B3 domain-containing protein REM9 n=1 Tax=Sesamum latifolium TaxID=2727402 RepID=A0AAW2UYM9_9LAMI